MQHYYVRCKHCHREYLYCTYGNGPDYGTEEGCSRDYCSECQKAIDDALGKIPVKYISKFKVIDTTPELLEFFRLVSIAYNNKVENDDHKGLFLPRIVPVFPNGICCSDYDNVDTCIYNGRMFIIEYNDGEYKNARVSLEMEYDCVKKCFTDKYWTEHGKTYYGHRRPFKAKDLVPVQPMAPPMGITFCENFDWDLVRKYEPKRKEPEHNKRTYTRVYGGSVVRNILTETRHDTKVAIPDYDVNSLYDWMDYQITYEKYDDEDFETVTDIKLHFDKNQL